MGYLTDEEINNISSEVCIIDIDKLDNMDDYLESFDSGIEEYNSFLIEADFLNEVNISKTHLMFYKETNELVGYITFSTDSVKLSPDEKSVHSLDKVPFASVPAMKVGKLAINKNLSEKAKRKGYGSFLLEMARAYTYSLNQIGIACRFITVDADIEYDENTTTFYYKNGFIENLKYKKNKASKMISMRIDIFNSDQIEELKEAK